MSRPRRWVTVGLCVAAAFAGGWVSSRHALGARRQDSPHFALEQLARVVVQIEGRYVDPVDRDVLLQGAIKGMVAELDPHSEYFPPKEFVEFAEETQGRFGGVGLEVDGRGELLTVVAPIEGGPAEAAGIKSGDEIVVIDGADARGLSVEKAVRLMRGTPDTRVEVTFRRPSEGGRLFRVSLVRAEIHVPSVTEAALPGSVLYLRIRQFQERTHTELLEAISRGRGKLGNVVRGVLLDLRRNPGGLVTQAVAVADEFLDGGVVFTMRGQGGTTVEEARASSGGALVGIPAVVLVDEASASASELLAGALQDPHRAIVVGAPTFGKGSVQSIIELPGGAGLKLTTARYYTPSGRAIQAQGIEPDVKVPATRAIEAKPGLLPREKDLPHALPAEATTMPKTLREPVGPGNATQGGALEAGVRVPPSTTADAGPPPLFPARIPDLEHDFQLYLAHQLVTGVVPKSP